MTRILIAIPAAILLAGSVAEAAPYGGVPQPTSGGQSPNAENYGQERRKQHAFFAVLQEGKKTQIADGGKLTDAHRAELERKLAAVQAGNY